MNNRRFPLPWTIERLPGGFKIVDANGQSLAYFYARENDNDANTAGVLTMDWRCSLIQKILHLGRKGGETMERIAKPANELEGLIREGLPDIVRRHLADVQIDRIDRNDDGPNWIAMPIWQSDPDNDDKRNFIAIMQGVRRDNDLLTNH